MRVQVLKRFEGPKGVMLQPGQILDLDGRNVPGLIEFRYLRAVEDPQEGFDDRMTLEPVVEPVPAPVAVPDAPAEPSRAQKPAPRRKARQLSQ
jgi:hypothetical protein